MAHLHTHSCMDIIIYVQKTELFPFSFTMFWRCNFFLANIIAKHLSFFTDGEFSQVDIINFHQIIIPNRWNKIKLCFCFITLLFIVKQRMIIWQRLTCGRWFDVYFLMSSCENSPNPFWRLLIIPVWASVPREILRWFICSGSPVQDCGFESLRNFWKRRLDV